MKQRKKKYGREGTSLNINKGRSGSRRTMRNEETIKVVRLYVENNARNVSCRRNGLGLSRSTFNKMKQDLKWYPYQIVTCHELRSPDYIRHFQFFQWFLNEYRNRRFLANIIVCDEAGFSLNSKVDSGNFRQYAPVGEPHNFSQRCI